MSGLVALLNEDGTPINPGLLDTLTTYMRFRGPDRSGTWSAGAVGLGHTLLVTTDEMAHQRQPFSIDGSVWISADVRIDDRATLRRELEAAGQDLAGPLNDAALVLHAYHAWGEGCIDHLLGDFAFVIWDGRQQLLFAARDPMGVKPLFYVRRSSTLAISNTLNCLRLHPAVSETLNPDAIRSYLATGTNSLLGSTAFADIQRLPPAHTLTISEGALNLRQYWTLAQPEPLDEARPDIIVETFRGLLEKAVTDRLRTDRVAVLMSGGLDSPSLAALANNREREQGGRRTTVRAFTGVYSSTLEDGEGYWAKMVADYLDIDITWLSFDLRDPLSHWEDNHWNTVEPSDGLITNLYYLREGNVSAYSRVGLFGYGADPIMYPSKSYLISLLKELQLARLIGDVGRYYRMRRKLPPPYLRTALRRGLSSGTERDRAGIDGSSQSLTASGTASRGQDRTSAWRSEAVRNASSDYWTPLLESYDPGNTGLQFEMRVPFFDLRLVNYALRLPSVPWCVQKEVLRQAMTGALPEPILDRPKQFLRGDPVESMIDGATSKTWPERLREVPAVGAYVDIDLAIKEAIAYNSQRSTSRSAYDSERILRPYALAYWIKNLSSFRNHSPAGELI